MQREREKQEREARESERSERGVRREPVVLNELCLENRVLGIGLCRTASRLDGWASGEGLFHPVF